MYEYLRGGFKIPDPVADQNPWVQTEIQEVLSECQETLFHSESDQALRQVIQRGCRVALLGDIQKPSGHGVTGCR